MMDLHRFFQNPFPTGRLGAGKLLAFTTDHLQRLKTGPLAAEFAGRIAATEAALAAVNDSLVADDSKLGGRKGRKQMKRKFRKTLPTTIGKLYGAVLARYGLGAPELRECFAGGRSAFQRSTDDALGSRLDAMIAGLVLHEADLGAPLVASAQALRDEWQTIYVASEASSGAKAKTLVDKQAARTALARELYLNLLALAVKFPDAPARLDEFMQPHLLGKR